MIGDKILLWLALLVGLVTFSLWSIIRDYFGIPIFYTGNSFFIFLLCVFLLNKFKDSLVCFLLFGLSLNNLIDELFFNPTEIQFNEIILLILLPILWHLKTKKHAR